MNDWKAPLRRGLLAVLAVCALALGLAVPAVAQGAGISLQRAPSPPQAIKIGAGTETYSFSMTWEGQAIRYDVRLHRPDGSISVLKDVALPAGFTSWNDNGTYAPVLTDPAGMYRIEVRFFSVAVGNEIPEATATAVFFAAPQLGSLRLVKYEDMNGNGQRDAGEPGVAGWRFRITAPALFGGGTTEHVTGSDGTVTVPNLPVGAWQVAEVAQSPWVPTTPASGTVTVTDGGTGEFVAGNVRPAPLSGTVWNDTNRNQVIDAGETPRSGVTITLTGTTGLGQAVTGSTVTTADGTYIFPGLMPGVYAVTMTTPQGVEATTPTVRSGRVILSNTPNPDNNFGVAPPAVTPTSTPQPPATPTTPTATGTPQGNPGIGIAKTGPRTAEGGDLITYRITVRSTGRVTARNVVVSDPIPNRMTLVALPQGATLTNGVVRWRLGNMAAGARRVLTLRLRLDPNAPAGRYTNTATVTATGLAPRRASTTLVVRATRPGRIGGVTG